MAIITVVSIFQHSELAPSEGKSVIVDSAGLSRNILITRTKDSATVAFSSQVVCIQAPCPEMRIEGELDFSERGMKYLDEFLAKHENGETINYAQLNFKDKRIIKSVVERNDDDITKYTLTVYLSNGELYMIETDRDKDIINVFCKYDNCAYPDGARTDKRAYDLVEAICESKHDSDVEKLHQAVLSSEDFDIINNLIKEAPAN